MGWVFPAQETMMDATQRDMIPLAALDNLLIYVVLQ
jgi:hypothetical protein